MEQRPGRRNDVTSHVPLTDIVFSVVRRSNDSPVIGAPVKTAEERDTRCSMSCRTRATRTPIETTNFRRRRRSRRRPNGSSDSSLRWNLVGRDWNRTETANKRTVARNDPRLLPLQDAFPSTEIYHTSFTLNGG